MYFTDLILEAKSYDKLASHRLESDVKIKSFPPSLPLPSPPPLPTLSGKHENLPDPTLIAPHSPAKGIRLLGMNKALFHLRLPNCWSYETAHIGLPTLPIMDHLGSSV